MYACWAALEGWVLKHSFGQLYLLLQSTFIKSRVHKNGHAFSVSLSQQMSDSSELNWRGIFSDFLPSTSWRSPVPTSIPSLLPVHSPQRLRSLIRLSHMSSDHHGRPVLCSIKRNGRCKPTLLSCNETESKNVRHQCAGTNDFQYCIICWRIFVAKHFVGGCKQFFQTFFFLFNLNIALSSCTTVILQFSGHFSCLPVIKLLIF